MRSHEVAAGIRTVTHVADYFQELQQTTRRLVERGSAQNRGYFSPVEEDEALGLLVSYWQTRNALFDLIRSYRLDRALPEGERPVAFFTAFAAALLLVDAARFLRETIHDRPLVRSMMNQPAPQFGIPAGVYDAVQQSLVSTRNAWHLYYAVQYYEQHESELRGLAEDDQTLLPVAATVDRLIHRLDISVARFAVVKLRTRSSQVLRSLSRDILGKALYGLQKFGGTLVADKYLRRGHQPQLPRHAAGQLRALLQPGDVLIVRKEYALTNYFLPGYWPHAALYLGAAAELQRLGIAGHPQVRPRWAQMLDRPDHLQPRVLESMKDGVHIRSLASPFASDSAVVLRPQLAPHQRGQALARCLAHEGKPYDFDFDFRRSDRLVCTEVVYRAYDGVGCLQLPLTHRAGRPTLSGGDLIGMARQGQQFQPVAVFAPRLGPHAVLTGRQVDDILEAGQGT